MQMQLRLANQELFILNVNDMLGSSEGVDLPVLEPATRSWCSKSPTRIRQAVKSLQSSRELLAFIHWACLLHSLDLGIAPRAVPGQIGQHAFALQKHRNLQLFLIGNVRYLKFNVAILVGLAVIQEICMCKEVRLLKWQRWNVKSSTCV